MTASWHRPNNGSRIRPAAVYFRDGTDDAIPFEAIISSDVDLATGERYEHEVGIIWHEDEAEAIVRALNATPHPL